MAEIELLLVDRSDEDMTLGETRFGGEPALPPGASWPRCRVCNGNMQFLGQLHRPDPARLLSLFMCQNRPGLCDEWDADRGANAVIRSPTANLVETGPPREGAVSRPTSYRAKSILVSATDYDAVRSGWAHAHEERWRDVLGQLGGKPGWLDRDETPNCDRCRLPMRFVAQLEEGPDHETRMNFGGRCAFVFECDGCEGDGKFLW